MPPVAELGRRATEASRHLRTAGTAPRDAALATAADLLLERAPDVLDANAADVAAGQTAGIDPIALDRLRLTDARLAGMAGALRQVAALPDPLGEVLDGWRRPNGLELRRIRVPLGVVAVIYENRPNVTSDAAAIALKAGNAVVLRGSAGAQRSNRVIADVVRDGLTKAGLPADAAQLVDDPSHDAAVALMRLTDDIDCLIPRGGPALLASVREHATVPVIIDGDGNCHVYVDAAADLDQALSIVVNSKTSRPGVCNAAESLLVHAAVADRFVPQVGDVLEQYGVELLGDEPARRLRPMAVATDDDFGREFLDLRMTVGVAPSLDAAIEHINRFRVRAHRGHRDPRPRRGPALHPRGRRRCRHRQRLDALHRRGALRLRRRDRHLDPEAPRPRPDGAAGPHHLPLRGVG